MAICLLPLMYYLTSASPTLMLHAALPLTQLQKATIPITTSAQLPATTALPTAQQLLLPTYNTDPPAHAWK